MTFKYRNFQTFIEGGITPTVSRPMCSYLSFIILGIP